MSLHQLNQSADSFAAANVLHRHVGRHLLQRLAPITIAPKTILDLGCGTGELIAELRTLFPEAEIVGVDVAEERVALAQKKYPELEFCTGHLSECDFAPQRFDLVVSNLMLHWLDDMPALLKSVFQVLSVEGLLLLSFYGPDTFKNAGTPLGNFFDMHDVGDALVRGQFNDPVLDIERFNLEYDENGDIHAELENNGELALVDLAGSAATQLDYEIVYGHAWKLAEPMTSKIDQDGMVRISPGQIMRKKVTDTP